MLGIGAPELVLILILALIFIGPQKLPEIARTLGKSYRELTSALDGVKKDFADTGESFKREAGIENSSGNILDVPQHTPSLSHEDAKLLDVKRPDSHIN